MRMKISKKMVAQAKRSAMKRSSVLSFEKMTPNQISESMGVSKSNFLMSFEWKELRRKAIEKYGAKCMKCKRMPINLALINVDHIKPRKYFPDLALCFDNLQILCSVCNKEKGNKNQIDYRPLV